MPDLSFERAGWQHGARQIAGVDEVGRGPLAGPVTAAAVILNRDAIPDGLNDSKKLSHKRRTTLAEAIHATAQVAIVHVGVEEIDQVNILRASHLAMVRALAQLRPAADLALIDGNMIPRGLPCTRRTVVKGDARSRVDCGGLDRGQNWRAIASWWIWRNSTPATAGTQCRIRDQRAHMALQNLGVTPHHRRSFKPVHNILYQEKL